jgi:t-SNARE complex subunit (syntaxin)
MNGARYSIAWKDEIEKKLNPKCSTVFLDFGLNAGLKKKRRAIKGRRVRETCRRGRRKIRIVCFFFMIIIIIFSFCFLVGAQQHVDDGGFFYWRMLM